MVMMHISVRQQLSLLLILTACVGLGILAIATWVVNHDFVLNVASNRLATSASLKAAQLAFNLELMQTAAFFVATRAIIQNALTEYNNGTADASTFQAAQRDLAVTLGNSANAIILQAEIFSRNISGPAGTSSLLNVTGSFSDDIQLPWLASDGSRVHLGDADGGYPPALYPNLTITNIPNENASLRYEASYNGFTLNSERALVLGPMVVSSNFSLVSLTIPITNDLDTTDILGWVTVVCDARLLQIVIQDQTGIGDTGQTLLVGPVNSTNQYPPGVLGTDLAADTDVRFAFPIHQSASSRHPHHVYGSPNQPFLASKYPAVEEAMELDARAPQDYGSLVRTHNEENKAVSVGYSFVPTNLVDWVVVVEQARSEVWEPINRLRDIILACLFSVMGLFLIISFPIAHMAVLPIMRLKRATEESTDPYHRRTSSSETSCGRLADEKEATSLASGRAGLSDTIAQWRQRKWKWHVADHVEEPTEDEKRFRIPGKVKERKHWVRDEVTDLITTFNAMSDELLVQYTGLEEKVRQRTMELEQSKKAAEAANESKTLFVANVSHELKTPLNGILGMCAVCLEEDDPKKLKRSLTIIYKSGDLLLRTLQDLLTFSQNQMGHQVITLEEKEFVLGDLETQVLAIFGQTAIDRQIDLKVRFEDPSGDTLGMYSRLRDITLWGDIHRILQVLINLTSNSLKFTPPNGSVTVVMRCLSEMPQRHSSLGLARSTSKVQTNRNSVKAGSINSGTANFINPHEGTGVHEKCIAPPGRDLLLEIDVHDTGPGIPDDMQGRIFEPFVQADAGLSRKHSGTGLGLSICSQLASLMKGSIGLKSKLGDGSTFTLKLPLRHVAAARSCSASSSQDCVTPSSRRTSLAVIEDEHLPISNGKPGAPLAVVTGLQKADSTDSTGTCPTAIPKLTDTPLRQAVKNASKEARTKKHAQQDFSHIRVLVAEDNKVNQEVIMRMLKLEKIHDVTIAEDGQIAFDLVKTKSAPERLETAAATEGTDDAPTPPPPFDLILMDIQMPNMDGLTSTRLIRKFGYKQPIVALTAFAEQSNIDECYGSGMDYFLAKPVRRPQLKKVLTDYCPPSPSSSSPSKTDSAMNGEVQASESAHGAEEKNEDGPPNGTANHSSDTTSSTPPSNLDGSS
ncbi:Two-component system B [Lecanosticta acicola]|uniref:histidine kinase n=1 Tax=Lecanosticta acicola TaxID=111012 RepID=A0AAI8YWY9_9PEZI|nr:Two-component system B [Lecanosticta acicola]